jgi:hypothetical protein
MPNANTRTSPGNGVSVLSSTTLQNGAHITPICSVTTRQEELTEHPKRSRHAKDRWSTKPTRSWQLKTKQRNQAQMEERKSRATRPQTQNPPQPTTFLANSQPWKPPNRRKSWSQKETHHQSTSRSWPKRRCSWDSQTN